MLHKYWAFMNWLDSEKILNNIQNFFMPLIGWLILILLGVLYYYSDSGRMNDEELKKR